MNYSSYQDRKPGDRIADQSGRAGVVIDIRGPMTGYDAVAVKWEDGSIDRNYISPQKLVLLARNTPAGRISRSKLAEMLKKR